MVFKEAMKNNLINNNFYINFCLDSFGINCLNEHFKHYA